MAGGGRFLVVVGLACACPTAASAAPAAPQAEESFDDLYVRGQDELSRGEPLAAAHTLTAAAARLPEDDPANRAELFDEIADAYERACEATSAAAVLDEAVTALDAYAADYERRFPGVTLHQRGLATLRRLRDRQAADSPAEPIGVPTAERPSPTSPSPATAPPARASASPELRPTRPWRGLMIGGGVTTTVGVAMLGLMIGGYVRGNTWEARIEDPERACDLRLLGECAALDARGRRSEVVYRFGQIASPILVATGVALLVVGARRRGAARTLAPVLRPSYAGLVWQQRF